MRGSLLAAIVLCGFQLFPVHAQRRNGTGCPADVALIPLCSCQVWLSGLRIECTGASFPDLVARLNKMDLPISSLRLRGMVGMAQTLPMEALGKILVKELDISGNKVAGLSNMALEPQRGTLRLLRIANSTITAIPKLTDFPVLESLDLTGNDIAFVADNFPPTLTQLRLKNNRICSLSPSALDSAKKSLMVLDLAENCLRAFPTITLRGAPKLTHLDLSRNDMGPELPFQSIVELPSLVELRLANNPIFKLNDRAFAAVPKLKHLSFRKAGLSELRRGAFPPSVFPSMALLDLRGNGLRVLPTGLFQGLPKLQQVFLDDNLLTTIKTAAFASDPDLQLISLQNNRLRNIEAGALQDLKSLLVLLLTNNTIPHLEEGQFPLPSLRQMSVKGNLLERIHPKAFRSLEALTTLDLSYNRLTRLSVGTLEPLKSLLFLDLSQNRISGFPEGAFPARRIPNFILSGNPLDCSRTPVTPLLTFLSKYNTRTTMPDTPPLTCSGINHFSFCSTLDQARHIPNFILSGNPLDCSRTPVTPLLTFLSKYNTRTTMPDTPPLTCSGINHFSFCSTLDQARRIPNFILSGNPLDCSRTPVTPLLTFLSKYNTRTTMPDTPPLTCSGINHFSFCSTLDQARHIPNFILSGNPLDCSRTPVTPLLTFLSKYNTRTTMPDTPPLTCSGINHFSFCSTLDQARRIPNFILSGNPLDCSRTPVTPLLTFLSKYNTRTTMPDTPPLTCSGINHFSFCSTLDQARRIPNFILSGNPLDCSRTPVTPLLTFLSKYNTRTTMPDTPPITCSGINHFSFCLTLDQARRIPNFIFSGNPLDCSRTPVTPLLTFLSKYNIRTTMPDTPPLTCSGINHFSFCSTLDQARRIPNFILSGNPLDCSRTPVTPLLTFLSKYNTHTTMPDTPPITCSGINHFSFSLTLDQARRIPNFIFSGNPLDCSRTPVTPLLTFLSKYNTRTTMPDTPPLTCSGINHFSFCLTLDQARRIPNFILSGNPLDCSRTPVTPLLTFISKYNTRTTMPDTPPLTCSGINHLSFCLTLDQARRIPNFILSGNPLDCSRTPITPLLTFLSKYNTRTTMPDTPPLTCSGINHFSFCLTLDQARCIPNFILFGNPLDCSRTPVTPLLTFLSKYNTRTTMPDTPPLTCSGINHFSFCLTLDQARCIPNFILFGNPLDCSRTPVTPLLTFLSKYNTRTTMPDTPPLTCSGINHFSFCLTLDQARCIPNFILFGNPLDCSRTPVTPLLTFLSKYNTRTTMPDTPPLTCSGINHLSFCLTLDQARCIPNFILFGNPLDCSRTPVTPLLTFLSKYNTRTTMPDTPPLTCSGINHFSFCLTLDQARCIPNFILFGNPLDCSRTPVTPLLTFLSKYNTRTTMPDTPPLTCSGINHLSFCLTLDQARCIPNFILFGNPLDCSRTPVTPLLTFLSKYNTRTTMPDTPPLTCSGINHFSFCLTLDQARCIPNFILFGNPLDCSRTPVTPLLTFLSKYNTRTTMPDTPPLTCSGINHLSFCLTLDQARCIPNFILFGNPLDCSRTPVTPLLTFLSKYNTRTTMPDTPPLTCSVPHQLAGKELKEVVLIRANETFFRGLDSIVPGGFKPGGKGTNALPLANLFPSLDRIPGVEPLGVPGLNSPIPGLNTVSRAISGFSQLPGVNALTNPSIRSPGESDDLLRTFHDFTKPLSKFVVGERPSAADVETMLGSLPKIAQQLPTITNIDLTKASPAMIKAFLSGEELPGLPIPPSARAQITRRILSQMSRAAEAANQGMKFLPDGTAVTKLLPPLSSLPAETVKEVLAGGRLPQLSAEETRSIRDYYTARFVKERTADSPQQKANPELDQALEQEIRAADERSQLPVDELMSVLGKDLSRVPDSIITSIAKGEPLQLRDVSLFLGREGDPGGGRAKPAPRG